MLIKHGRASAAFTVLQMALDKRAAIQPGLIFDALEAWIESRTSAAEAHQGVSFQIQLLFQELQGARRTRPQRSIVTDWRCSNGRISGCSTGILLLP